MEDAPTHTLTLHLQQAVRGFLHLRIHGINVSRSNNLIPGPLYDISLSSIRPRSSLHQGPDHARKLPKKRAKERRTIVRRTGSPAGGSGIAPGTGEALRPSTTLRNASFCYGTRHRALEHKSTNGRLTPLRSGGPARTPAAKKRGTTKDIPWFDASVTQA